MLLVLFLYPEAELDLKESLGKTFLEVASKILPGISRLKAYCAFLTHYLTFFAAFYSKKLCHFD